MEFIVSLQLTSRLSFLVTIFSSILSQGRREGVAEGAVCTRASGSRGPRELILKFLFKASLDVFKEPPNRSSVRCSKSASRFSSPRFHCFLPLQLASITDSRASIGSFAPGPRNPLGGPVLSRISQRKVCVVIKCTKKWKLNLMATSYLLICRNVGITL